MPRFAANLSMLYTEHAFMDRFAAAARDGFAAVEYLFPFAFEASALAARLQESGLQQVLFNAPPGNWDAGERGLACLPGREAEFRAGFAKALDYGAALGCPRIHVMAGIAPAGSIQSELHATYLGNLEWAASQALLAGRDVLIEPINTRDMPGYFLNRHEVAQSIVQTLGVPNLKVQFDLYHCQVMEGDIARKIREHLPTGRIGHFQVAGVPERHEPSVGELNFDYLFTLIDAVSATSGWTGWVGCEYRPALGAAEGATTQGLTWLRRWQSPR